MLKYIVCIKNYHKNCSQVFLEQLKKFQIQDCKNNIGFISKLAETSKEIITETSDYIHIDSFK